MKYYVISTVIILYGLLACKNVSEKRTRSTENIRSPNSSKNSIEKVDSAEIKSAWKNFYEVIQSKNCSDFKKLSFDSIRACHTVFNASDFCNKCFKEIFDEVLLRKIKEGKIRYNIGSEKNQIQIIKEVRPRGGEWIMTFDFTIINGVYKFYECDSFGGEPCCR